jgi:hypothetical protein
MKCYGCKEVQPYLSFYCEVDDKDFCSVNCKIKTIKKYALQHFENKYYQEISKKNCCYCNNEFIFNVNLDCGHKYCEICVKMIIDLKINCPVCQSLSLITNEVNMEYLTLLHSRCVNNTWKTCSYLIQTCDPERLEELYSMNYGRDLRNDLNNIIEYFNYLREFL